MMGVRDALPGIVQAIVRLAMDATTKGANCAKSKRPSAMCGPAQAKPV
jgi:hypothetical protein